MIVMPFSGVHIYVLFVGLLTTKQSCNITHSIKTLSTQGSTNVIHLGIHNVT
jgi:hypothetical protein